VKSLLEQGFFVDSIFNAIRIRYLNGREEWEEVLRLRRDAYHSVGKMVDKKLPEEHADEFDRYSRHIVAVIGGRIVGAARVVFCGKDPARSEHHMLNIKVPDKIQEAGFVEFSRFCTNADFRGGDIFVALIRQAAHIATHSRLPFIVANCNSDLKPLYEKLGFRAVGKPFPAFGRKECYLIVNKSLSTIRLGKYSNFAAWNYILAPIVHFHRHTALGRYRFFHPWHLIQRFATPVLNWLRIKKRYSKFKQKRAGR
ncbi:GNAT family N-acetyltransferase, partial [bacterium]|nr:GNAT family N-acetyltransferase [bacterium]